MTVRIGVLGAARIAPSALITPAAELDGVEVAVVAARDTERAKAFAQTHGIPRVAANYQDVIDDAGIDAIYNPLPISLHAPWTIAALEAGKHVLCEKPFALNAVEAERMVAAGIESGRVLAEAFHWRYHPIATRMAEIVEGGAIGTLQTLEATFTAPIPDLSDIRHQLALGGGALMDLGCYPVQFVRFLAGGRPEVTGAVAVEGMPGIDVTMTADLRWPSGVTARVHCSMAVDTPVQLTLTAVGDGGQMDVVNPVAPHHGNQVTVTPASGEATEESVSGPSTYRCQLEAFLGAVRDGASLPTGGTDSIETMQVLDAIYGAAGLPVRGGGRR